MQKTTILLLTALALNYGNAAGTLACKFTYPLEATCFIEQVIYNIHNFELAAGVELTTTPATFTPYTAIAWYDKTWFTVLEIATRISNETRFTANLTIGINW